MLLFFLIPFGFNELIFFSFFIVDDETGEWWDTNVINVLQEALFTGTGPNKSDAITINGQPGDFFQCSNQGQYLSITNT